MAEVKITEMTADSSVTGVEILPVSDAGSPKRVTIDQIKQFVIDSVEAVAAGTAVTGADSVFILQSGALKPVDIDVVAQHVIDTVWGKAAEATPADGDKLALKDDGGIEKTVLLSVLASYILAEIESDLLDISSLADGSGTIAAANKMLVVDGTTPKRVTITNLSTLIYASLKAYVTALGAVTVSASSDVFYCVQGGVEKKVTLAEIVTLLGDPPAAPATTTLNGIPQWSNVTGDLKDGLTLATTVGTPGGDTIVPSEQAVREALSSLINDQADIGAAIVDADTFLIDDGGAGTQKKSAVSRLWTYITGQIQGLSAKTAAVAADILTIQDSEASSALKELTLANLKVHLDTVGTYEEIWIPAGAMTPNATAPAAADIYEYATNDMTHDTLLFDGIAQDEYAEFNVVMPSSWNRGTIKAKVFWAPGHADANVDEWVLFTLAAGAFSNDDALDAVLGTAQDMADRVIADDDLHITAASAAITVGGTPALGDLIHFKLRRDYDYTGGGTAMDVDARVFGALIQYQKTQSVAAW